ncbi:MAG TPA: hypothetical protein VGN69_07010 [Solirubrobacteraceae bacterium]|jgi:hypothetical protein|nr:hypothetical protein [Solirubrobacteraceae bacterium]
MTAALNTLVGLLATADGEPSKTPFYVAGGLLAGWAVLVSVLGMRRADFPGSRAGARAVMAISALLVIGAASMAVVTSGTPRKDKAPGTSAAPQPKKTSAEP